MIFITSSLVLWFLCRPGVIECCMHSPKLKDAAKYSTGLFELLMRKIIAFANAVCLWRTWAPQIHRFPGRTSNSQACPFSYQFNYTSNDTNKYQWLHVGNASYLSSERIISHAKPVLVSAARENVRGRRPIKNNWQALGRIASPQLRTIEHLFFRFHCLGLTVDLPDATAACIVIEHSFTVFP